MSDPISTVLDQQVRQAASQAFEPGPVARIAEKYNLDSPRLLGLLLKLDFGESHILTCDAWKRQCGGVPRGSFVVFRIDPRAVNSADAAYSRRLILARITDAAPTPVETNVQQTLFQVHKLQAKIDPLTHQDLQWGALKATIVGTYYDEGPEIAFGNDVDTFFSPLAYVAYSPTDEHLDLLINSFVRTPKPIVIGHLRYTETPSLGAPSNVPILIDPADIVGEPNAAQRLANFGMTRYGKSNSNKIIAKAIFDSGLDVSQVFLDPVGEYTYVNAQDGGTSLFAQYHSRSVRYALSEKPLLPEETKLGISQPRLLAIDFYNFCGVGHSLITSLWDTENDSAPGYMRPILDAAIEDTSNCPPRSNRSGYNHYWRTVGLWYALLHKANFTAPSNLKVPITFQRNMKTHLAAGVPGVARTPTGEFDETGQPITALPAIYQAVWAQWKEHAGQTHWFEPGSDGTPYFNDAEEKMLRVLSDSNLIAHNYLRPFNKYHSPRGSSIFADIATHVAAGTSVFIDMSQANETVRNNLVERICREIFREQNRRFNSLEGLGNRFVMFYFEEAHRLFSRDDSNLNSIYNLLAKEGAKLNIGMIYSTQSMTTVSPDLLKNTDNFIIAHLDDDREVKEVTRKHAFRDVAEDVQRVRSRGFVRMITRSHRFALPVQILKFEP